ncbi:MAG: tetratricopeptide repeat protein [Burkholderiaceae bacterium]|nr:tetratricopeptide repeat protein [Burkholderiaceae bacterium]
MNPTHPRMRWLGWLRSIAGRFACALTAATAWADPFNVSNPTAGEMARLPEYCPYTVGYHRGGPADPVRADWLAKLGPTLAHVHHYCWALLMVHRSQFGGVTPEVRAALLRRAISDIHYVLRNGESDFVLLPELFYRLGTYHAALGEWPLAVEFLDRSRESKQDYWPPYVELASVNLQLGRRQQAIDILKEGLRVMPNERQLNEALRRVETTPPDGKAVPLSSLH